MFLWLNTVAGLGFRGLQAISSASIKTIWLMGKKKIYIILYSLNTITNSLTKSANCKSLLACLYFSQNIKLLSTLDTLHFKKPFKFDSPEFIYQKNKRMSKLYQPIASQREENLLSNILDTFPIIRNNTIYYILFHYRRGEGKLHAPWKVGAQCSASTSKNRRQLCLELKSFLLIAFIVRQDNSSLKPWIKSTFE